MSTTLKETNEGTEFFAKLINALYDALRDGKINADDLTKALPPILAATPGLTGLNQAPQELAGATNTQLVETDGIFGGNLSTLPSELSFDVTRIFGAITSIVRMVSKKAQADAIRATINYLRDNGDSLLDEPVDTAVANVMQAYQENPHLSSY